METNETVSAMIAGYYLCVNFPRYYTVPIRLVHRCQVILLLGCYLSTSVWILMVTLTCSTTDCNDNNSLEHPNQTWYQDIDKDGYSNGNTKTLCLKPADYKASSELTAVSGDCDDNDPLVNPGAEGPYGDTTCNDGKDNNCNQITDIDDPVCQCIPSTEICDGKDNDCDGQIDELLIQHLLPRCR